MQVTILGQNIDIACAGRDQKRLADLAAALEQRLGRYPEDLDATRRLALAALALMDEAQTTGAALALARSEIERLTDMLVDAKLEAANACPVDEERGRVSALRLGA